MSYKRLWERHELKEVKFEIKDTIMYQYFLIVRLCLFIFPMVR